MTFTGKVLLTMRLTALILLCACLQVCAKGYSQITLSETDAPLQKVFKEIQKQTGYDFLFSSELLKQAGTVSVDLKNVSLQQAVEECLKGKGLDYEIQEKTVIIKKKPFEALPSAGDSSSAFTPPIDVHGHITDSLGNPLAGASIFVKGSKKGTETNSKGDFTIYGVNDNATLIISFTGYGKKQIKVNGTDPISIALDKSNDILDQVQVIAYGTTTRRLSVGNITTVSAETIEKQPVQNVLLALQGQVPGLFITQANGLNGGAVTVRIQGQNSIANGNAPFYVIDGVPYASQFLTDPQTGVLGQNGDGGYGSPFSYINPSDIERVDILKDADATAIYGSCAANGAILITTKKGKAGAAKFNLNLQQGYSEVGHFVDMMNTQQYLGMRYQAFHNDGIDWTQPSISANDLKVWDTTRNTNWQKTLIGGTAQYTNITGSLSGGSAFVQYLISGTYNRQTTVFPGSFADQKGSVHFSLTSASANQKFHIQFSGNYMLDDNKLPGTDLTQESISMEPDAPSIYKPDGTLNWEQDATGTSTWANPLAYTLQTFENKTTNLVSNAVLSYNIIQGLDIKTSFGYTDYKANSYTPYPLTSYPPEDRPYYSLISFFGNSNASSWIIEPQATYKRAVGKGKLDLLFGGTIQQNQSDMTSLYSYGYSSPQLMQDIAAASTIISNGSSYSQYKYAAMYGRANYVWQDKYIIDLTARRDGSSRFGPSEQFHDFWSIGAGWIFSDEAPFKNSKVFSFGKLHGSYGTTGNDQIGNYQFLSLYNPTYSQGLSYQNTSGLVPGGLSNPYLEWEETRKLQVGIDLGFIDNRVLLNAIYALNRSSNQLLTSTLPILTGFTSILQNLAATVQNTDWEFTLNTINVKSKDFNWSSRINFTVPNNKLIAFPGLASSPFYSAFYIVGQPLTFSRLSHFAGVDPATGQYQFADKKGTPTFTPTYPDDYNIIQSTLPKYYGGFQNTFTYKGFQLDFTFSFVKQLGPNYSFYNGLYITPGMFDAGLSNQPTSVLNHWQKPGDIAPVQAYSTMHPASIDYAEGSNYAFTNASYAQLKNLSLSWQLPKAWITANHLQNSRIYFQCQNLLTITPDKAVLNPETGFISLPPLRTITIGLQTGF